ncbi:Fe(2+) transporter permease subunit FeoB [Endozoicomonas numazuensis]|uniref:Ferrous iron transport protein B n=1 Tax=Endozoicomonas numazuensis TaxID=1137799 RepID=A0A081NH27_9GAMM|nr:Fe(2+) transporter permease subunit FeoB [Endozoicomonas numazuensis]KEQ17750.1 iron transporter FeoB [Endozoicomonas numazuensis]
MKDHVFAIVGNPNCGKTTVFNALTGARQHVGNWPGVTVEKRSGRYQHKNQSVEVVDLPGTYCLDVVDDQVSMDERIARDFILAREARLVVNVVDASNIERNLYLTTQLLDMGLPVIVVLNMMDVAKDKGLKINAESLSRHLGCPVHAMVASRDRGTRELKDLINQCFLNGIEPARSQSLGMPLEESVCSLQAHVSSEVTDLSAARWVALKLLEGEDDFLDKVSLDLIDKAAVERSQLEAAYDADMDIIVANGRYETISLIMKDTVNIAGIVSHGLTERIDSIVLNRILGLPIFFGVMYLMFMFSVNIGSAFIDFFDILSGTLFVDGVSHLLENIGAPGWIIALLGNGVGGGIQTVSTFIPVIAFLFLFLSVLEDSGYMARAAFVMDRAMRFLGLPGKSFVPMLVGFGCNVPAIMATRTLENQQDRMLTIAMAPFMSCGARLPVYALFAAAFFPGSGQNVVFTLYLAGILAAVMTGLMLKKCLFSGEVTPFVMELPNYHMPSVKHVLLRTWDRLKAFLFRAGKAIVVVVVILNTLNSLGTDGSFGHEDTQSSVLSKIGQTITPAFAPMGMTDDNWPAAVGLFTGILAKEAVVGTLNSMYTSIADQENGTVAKAHGFDFMASLNEALATIPANLSAIASSLADPLGLSVGDLSNLEEVAQDQEVEVTTFGVMQRLFTSDAAVIAYLLMILLYTPCVAALGAIYRESGLRWTFFVAGWTFFLGYSVATIYYQLSLITLQPVTAISWLSTILAAMVLMFVFLRRAGQRMVLSPIEVPSERPQRSSGCH